MKKRDIKWWNTLDYKSSIDYMLASLLLEYGFDPLEAIVWYYNKKKKTMIFQSNYQYYEIKNKKVKRIEEKEVWSKKNND